MLKLYPEIKKFFKPYPLTAFYITLINLIQLSLAYCFYTYDSSWLWIFLVAYLLGAILNHNLFVFIHESSHDAIFGSRFWDRLFGVFCNIAQATPSAMSFRNFHLIHHSNMNQYDYDADLAFLKEAKWVGNIWWRKVLWFLLFFAIESVRPLKLKKGSGFDRWIFFNIIFILFTDYLIFKFFGFKGLSYLLLSTLFSVGLHPVGARWIQEHYTYKEGQETYSYYGPMNRLSFNIGYHNEHHDFYKVPWRYLPTIKSIAPEFYDNLYYHTSWSKLLLDFIFNPHRDLFCRIVRDQKTTKPTISNAPSLR